MSDLLFAWGVFEDDRTPRERARPEVVCMEDELSASALDGLPVCTHCQRPIGQHTPWGGPRPEAGVCRACRHNASSTRAKKRERAERRATSCACGRRIVDGRTCGRRCCR